MEGGNQMNIVRFTTEKDYVSIGVMSQEKQIIDLTAIDRKLTDIIVLHDTASKNNMTTSDFVINLLKKDKKEIYTLEDIKLLTPVSAPEVWAAGVTYQVSMQARNHETTEKIEYGGNSFYDKVYDAERPELFLKSTKERTIGMNQNIYLRSDSDWQIPEPELGLVLNDQAKIVGYTIGNDMSSRDIEGENPLYLPQAKIWKNSCSIGPTIRLAETVTDPYDFEITCRIYRDQSKVFEGSTKLDQLKRKLEELIYFLAKDNIIFNGTVLLTGTCVIPPNDFTLQEGDRIEIEVPGIGVLSNPVKS